MTQTSEQNVPKLRFPGFEGPWDKTELQKIARIFDGTHQTPKYTTQGVPFVSVENIKDIYGPTKFISEAAFAKDFKTTPQKDDILMTRITAGIIGATAIVENNHPLAYYVSLALIRPGNYSDTPFLAQRIESDGFKRELHKRIIHVAFPKKINLGDIGKCTVTLPTLPEQRKIASFLGAMDTKIAQLAEKKRLLEDYKKGCMQQLFNQKIRFKDEDGKDFPDWEEKRLGEVLVESKKRTSTNNQHPILSSSRGGIVFQDEYFNHQTASEDNTGYKVIKHGQLTYRSMSDTGDFFFNIQTIAEFGIVSPAYPVFSVNNQHVSEFVWRSMNHAHELKRQILMMKSGGTRLALPFSRLCQMTIMLPHPDEQRKIADFLSAIDRKIDLVGQELEHAKTFKKGLLQQMFV